MSAQTSRFALKAVQGLKGLGYVIDDVSKLPPTIRNLLKNNPTQRPAIKAALETRNVELAEESSLHTLGEVPVQYRHNAGRQVKVNLPKYTSMKEVVRISFKKGGKQTTVNNLVPKPKPLVKVTLDNGAVAYSFVEKYSSADFTAKFSDVLSRYNKTQEASEKLADYASAVVSQISNPHQKLAVGIFADQYKEVLQQYPLAEQNKDYVQMQELHAQSRTEFLKKVRAAYPELSDYCDVVEQWIKNHIEYLNSKLQEIGKHNIAPPAEGQDVKMADLENLYARFTERLEAYKRFDAAQKALLPDTKRAEWKKTLDRLMAEASDKSLLEDFSRTIKQYQPNVVTETNLQSVIKFMDTIITTDKLEKLAANSIDIFKRKRGASPELIFNYVEATNLLNKPNPTNKPPPYSVTMQYTARDSKSFSKKSDARVKVKARVWEFGLSEKAHKRLVAIAGHRYEPATDTLRLRCGMWSTPQENELYCKQFLTELIEEAKKADLAPEYEIPEIAEVKHTAQELLDARFANVETEDAESATHLDMWIEHRKQGKMPGYTMTWGTAEEEEVVVEQEEVKHYDEYGYKIFDYDEDGFEQEDVMEDGFMGANGKFYRIGEEDKYAQDRERERVEAEAAAASEAIIEEEEEDEDDYSSRKRNRRRR